MKTAFIAIILAASLALSSTADARSIGYRHAKSFVGTITAVGKNTLTVSVNSSTGGKSVKVKFGHGTTIEGVAGGSINSSLVGRKATIVTTGKGKASEIVVK
jgi:hypothetical protein